MVRHRSRSPRRSKRRASSSSTVTRRRRKLSRPPRRTAVRRTSRKRIRFVSRTRRRTRGGAIAGQPTRTAQTKSKVQFLSKTAPGAKQSFTFSAGSGRAKGAARKSTSRVLHPSVLKAQQELSDKFGVTTFGLRGQLSTIPTIESGGFSDINVGLGRFSDFNALAEAAIRKQVAIEVTKRQREGSGITISDGILSPTASLDAPIAVSDLREPNRIFSGFNEEGQPQFDGESKFNIDKIFDNLPLLGAAFIGILIVMRLVKKI